jgi:hypothetical protein
MNDDVEGRGVEAEGGDRGWLHDLDEVGADGEDVVAAELDADPDLAAGVASAATSAAGEVQDGADDTHRVTGGLVGETANFHAEGVASSHASVREDLDRPPIGDGDDQSLCQVLLDDFVQDPGGVAGAVAVIGENDPAPGRLRAPSWRERRRL